MTSLTEEGMRLAADLADAWEGHPGNGAAFKIAEQLLRSHLQSMEDKIAALRKALQAIKDSPGGGPGRRIASMALDGMVKADVSSSTTIREFRIVVDSAQPAASPVVLATEYGWLIENGKQQGQGLAYRFVDNDAGGVPRWTEDPNKALRFARRSDAEQYAYHDEDAWRIVEHAWDSTKVTACKAEATTQPPATASLLSVPQWQPIETAPKETELLGWREDCGPLLIMYTSYDRFASEQECDEMDEETLFQKDWFGSGIPGGFERLEGSETPTHWQFPPADPVAAAPSAGSPAL